MVHEDLSAIGDMNTLLGWQVAITSVDTEAYVIKLLSVKEP